MLAKIMGAIRALDPKLVSTVLTTALVRLVLELGGDPVGDPLYSGLISLAVGAMVGFFWPNDGTVLRTPQESGNAGEPSTEGFTVTSSTVPVYRTDSRP
jgi:hypothetical protein